VVKVAKGIEPAGFEGKLVADIMLEDSEEELI